MTERPNEVRVQSWSRLGRCLIFTAWLCSAAGPVRAQPLIVDLSNHLVAISAGFSGAAVLLFGAVEGEGDVVVVVSGPTEAQVVRRRERIFGIWVNRAQATITGVPAYWAIAASRPLAMIASPEVLERHHIGIEHLDFHVHRTDESVTDADYRRAVLRLKQETGLYNTRPGTVKFVSGRLFRTEMQFPANVPTGTYTVEVYLLRNGEVVSEQTTPLLISKAGLGAEVFDFANRHAALYGLLAVLLAASVGWLGAVVFRKV